MKVELELNAYAAAGRAGRFSLRLILHGRRVCVARTPTLRGVRAGGHLPVVTAAHGRPSGGPAENSQEAVSKRCALGWMRYDVVVPTRFPPPGLRRCRDPPPGVAASDGPARGRRRRLACHRLSSRHGPCTPQPCTAPVTLTTVDAVAGRASWPARSRSARASWRPRSQRPLGLEQGPTEVVPARARTPGQLDHAAQLRPGADAGDLGVVADRGGRPLADRPAAAGAVPAEPVADQAGVHLRLRIRNRCTPRNRSARSRRTRSAGGERRR